MVVASTSGNMTCRRERRIEECSSIFLLGSQTAKPTFLQHNYRVIEISDQINIYQNFFPDENFVIPHDQPGLISMANKGANGNGSGVFITLDKAEHLDGKHVCFGKVVKAGARLMPNQSDHEPSHWL